MEWQNYKEISGALLKDTRNQANQWCAGQPKVTLAFAIISSIGLLPFITALALTPLVIIVNLTYFVNENGLSHVVYLLFFQWFLIIIFVAILFILGFIMLSSIVILYNRNVKM